MSGAEIAAEVAAGLAEAGIATGTGRLVATLRKRSGPTEPWNATPITETDAETTVVQVQRKVRDGVNMTERTVKMLLLDPTGPVPAKGDQVAVGVAPANVTASTVWARIAEVDIVAPGGVPVLYKAMLEG